ncbi:MAG: hypothetical protein NW207_08590 [Cytophagales bacterium]|nr:hypothetical protein [Cytophagales bacterium]
MTELQYQILDELYFMVHYNDLANTLQMDDEVLIRELCILIQKQWVDYYKTVDGIKSPDIENWTHYLKQYYYLASKSGLLVHNSR